MFNLEKTLSAWRQSYAQRHAFSPEDLDELEQHLRDHVHTLMQEGKDAQQAFDEAIEEMGGWDNAEREYSKVFWQKARRQKRLGQVVHLRLAMLKNYFTVALRSIRKQKIYAGINILGLTAGLTGFLLIMVFVQYEFSFDRFYKDVDQIYKVAKRVPGDVYLGSDLFAVTQPALAPRLAEDFEEITAATSLYDYRVLITHDRNTYWAEGLWADQQFFDVFGLDLLRGNTAAALATPNAIVLTESLAKKIFGNSNPMGAILLLDNEKQFEVSGIIADPPTNATIQYSYLTSLVTDDYYNQQLAENRWNSNYVYTFFKIAGTGDIHRVVDQLPDFTDRHVYAGRSNLAPERREQFLVQPLKEVHLSSPANFDIGNHGSLTRVYLFIGISIIILLLACINYVNLALARSIKRSAEIGLRKTMGAQRAQLIWQFLGESAAMVSIAMGLAMIALYLLLPYFSELLQRSLAIQHISPGVWLPALIGSLIFIALLAGGYPAFFLSRLRPVDAMRDRSRKGRRSGLQQTLIVAQFSAAIMLVICGLVIHQQLNYMTGNDPGYDRSQIISVPIRTSEFANNGTEIRRQLPVLKSSLLQNAKILEVTAASSLPTNISWQQTITDWDGSRPNDVLQIHVNPVDYNYLDVFGIALAAGRDFNPDISSDASTACLINETTAKALGWTPAQAMGKQFMHDEVNRTVIGVVKDFHLHSMHHPIKPLLFFMDDGGRFDYLAFKVAPGDLEQTIAFARQTIEEASLFPFDYQFLDEQFEALYEAESRLGQIFGFFISLALIIASLGLFGLSAYNTEQRRKEIGVRKVLGASTGSIMILLSGEVSRLVIVASLIAGPIAYFAMHRWLQAFAYRIDIGPQIFIIPILMSLGIALLSVCYQSARAALANPVRSLRME